MEQVVKNIIILFVLLGSIQMQAQLVEFKSVDDAIELSLEKNPDLEIYKLKIEKSIQEYRIKKRSTVPTITSTIDYQNNIEKQTSVLPGELFGQPGESVNAQLGTQYNWNVGILMSKDMLNFERKLGVKLAKHNTKIETAQKESYVQLLKEQTALYYYGAVIVKHALANNSENLISAEKTLEVTNQKFEKGIIDLPSLNQAKITVNSIRQSIEVNENLFDNYISQLKTLLDLTENHTILFSETIDIENNQIGNVLSIEEDKNLITYNLLKEQSELDIRLKKAAFLPKLTGTKYIGYQQFYDDGGISFSSEDWHNNINFGFSLSIPIFSSYKNKGNLKIAKINDRINEQTLLNERKKSSNEDSQLLKDYNSGLNQLEFTKSNYTLYKKNVELSLQKYNSGVVSLGNHLKTYEDYLKSESNYLNSLSFVYTSYASILSRK